MTQDESLDILKAGYNVYLTGTAGSGKTFVLQSYINYLELQGKKVGVTASTGVAGTQLNGMTIHSWAGVGVREHISDDEIVSLLKRKYLHHRFKNLNVLIIDEISMLSAGTLDAVDKVLKAFKRSDLPFGGIQIVLCGDFFQLPPIERNAQGTRPQFIYRSPLWRELDLKICYLDKPYRQSDVRFLHMLDEIRGNKVTRQTWDLLKERFIQPLPKGIIPTKLYTHNDYADAVNTRELAKINAETHVYAMQSSGNESIVHILKKSCLAPEQLELKEGAFVMFVKNNFGEGYVNGTLGKIIGISDKNGYPVVETFSGKRITVVPSEWQIDDGEMAGSISQVPLRLAWAITIHKSQGMTLDAAEIDLGKSFVEGLGYVALSRVRTLEGIRLRSINRTALTVNAEIIRVDKRLRELSESISLD